MSGFVNSQEFYRRYALSPDKLRYVVLRILIAEVIVNGVHGSSPISGRGEHETVPVTGQSTLPVTVLADVPIVKVFWCLSPFNQYCIY